MVSRLLALDEAGTVETVHVRIAAAAAGVAPRTVWRWPAITRESGRAEPATRRHSFALTDALRARPSDLGPNVKALHDSMREHPDQAHPSPTTNTQPSPTTLYRAVREEQRAGRVPEISRPTHAGRDPDRYDRALAEPALPGTACEAGRITPPPTGAPAPAGTDPTATRPAPLDDGTRLHVPGAHPVSTRRLGAVAEALVHTVAARGIVCVYGDPGHGRTIALHQALRLLPLRVPYTARRSR
ncbi:hypothetical protein [Embleya sp. AB8]|uniref:hypothetical protein n=1 Tax=Embleya sp. AB8 TaxID=3156304 RepID=UPI003C74058A